MEEGNTRDNVVCHYFERVEAGDPGGEMEESSLSLQKQKKNCKNNQNNQNALKWTCELSIFLLILMKISDTKNKQPTPFPVLYIDILWKHIAQAICRIQTFAIIIIYKNITLCNTYFSLALKTNREATLYSNLLLFICLWILLVKACIIICNCKLTIHHFMETNWTTILSRATMHKQYSVWCIYK